MAGTLLGAPTRFGFRLQFGQPAMESEAEPDGRPITVDEGREFIGRERRRARLARFVHGEVGLAEHVAHGLGPGFFVELDQALEFAQDMGVAESVVDRVQPLQLAGNAKPRFVEMANLHFGHALADTRIDLPQVFSLLSNPGHDAGRADQRRAEKIAQSLRGPILGYELLDIEIDRRGPRSPY